MNKPDAETTDCEALNGWVLYDADCRFCVELVSRAKARLEARHFRLLPLQTPWVQLQLGMTGPELLVEMRLLQPNGKIFGGADAVLELCRHYWLTQPIYQLGKIPIFTRLFREAYRWIAERRHCVNGACDLRTVVVKGSTQ